MDNYNELVLTRENFGDKLYQYVFSAIKILLMADYEIEILEEEGDIIVIRYNWNRNLGYGNATLAWITQEARELFRMLNNDEITIQEVSEPDEEEDRPETVNPGFEPDRNEEENFSVRKEEDIIEY